MRSADEALRAAYPQALATLIRVIGRAEQAEDALHTAVERALLHWQEGVPDRPVAWLVRVARNAFIDRGRRSRTERRYVASAVVDGELILSDDQRREDMLALIFTCCDPSLTPDSQVALTLRTVVGLSVDEIAKVYMVPAKTMERRITRARSTLRQAEVAYAVPGASELPERLAAVCAVVYVIFTDGYSFSGAAPALRPRLCELAIRLGRLLCRLFRQDTEVSGLLALMLLQHAHSPARLSESGAIVSLEYQDRALWDAGLIRDGCAMVERALRRHDLGPYQVQAAIAAVHAGARAYVDTDWAQIAELYDVLSHFQPGAVVLLNRAIAVFQAHGEARGFEAMRALEVHSALAGYHLYHAAWGHMYEQTGDGHAAREAYERALALADSEAEKEELSRRIERLNSETPQLC